MPKDLQPHARPRTHASYHPEPYRRRKPQAPHLTARKPQPRIPVRLRQ